MDLRLKKKKAVPKWNDPRETDYLGSTAWLLARHRLGKVNEGLAHVVIRIHLLPANPADRRLAYADQCPNCGIGQASSAESFNGG